MRSDEAPHSADCPRPTTRTAAATAGRMRASENRGADKLEGRGWACYPPEEAEWVRSLVAAAKEQKANPR